MGGRAGGVCKARAWADWQDNVGICSVAQLSCGWRRRRRGGGCCSVLVGVGVKDGLILLNISCLAKFVHMCKATHSVEHVKEIFIF